MYKGYITPLEVELYNSLSCEVKFKKLYNTYVGKLTKTKIKLKKLFSK